MGGDRGVTSLVELCCESLEFAGVPRDSVRVELFESDRLDGNTRWGGSTMTVRIASRLEDRPARGVITALHEAAHILSGDTKHTHLFQEQWRRLSSREFLAALDAHLAATYGRQP